MPTLFRVRFGIVQRSQGQTATGRSEYQRCEGQYAAKASEHAGHWMMVPDGAPAWAHDPNHIWEQAQAMERRGDAQLARTIEITVPRAVPAHLHRQFVAHCLQPLINDGMTAQVDLHHERATDSGWNDHAHVMLTMRKLDGDGFARTKERGWNSAFTADHGRAMREQFATRMNEFFAANEIAAKVDAKSYEVRGLPPPAPEVPKRLWKQWERERAKAPTAPPPKKIAEYRRWMAERAVVIQAGMQAQQELKNHGKSANYSSNQTGHDRNPGAARTGRRGVAIDAVAGVGRRDGRRIGGTAGSGGRPIGTDRRRAAQLAAASAQLSGALTPEVLDGLKAQVAAIRTEGRAALMEREARELMARAVRQTDADRVLAGLVPPAISKARNQAWVAAEKAKEAVQRHNRSRPTGIMSRFNGEAGRWQQEHDRLTNAMGAAQTAYGRAVEHEESIKKQFGRQAIAMAAENKSLNTADRAEAAELRQVAQALRAYHVPTLDAVARRQPPTRRKGGGGGGGGDGGSGTMAQATKQPDSYKTRTDTNGVGDIGWMLRKMY